MQKYLAKGTKPKSVPGWQKKVDSLLKIQDLQDNWDVVVLTGDEFCNVADTRFTYRQYYFHRPLRMGGSDDIAARSSQKEVGSFSLAESDVVSPLFFPLGARKEFQL